MDIKGKVIFDDNKTVDIMTVGELLIDMISNQYEGEVTSNGYNMLFGGSPSNIAMNVTKLGLKARVLSCVGKDSFGDFLIQKLKDRSINTDLIQRADKSTSMVVVTKSKGTPTPIFYRDADYDIQYNDYIEETITKCRVLHFSSWPISQQTSRNTLEKIIDKAKKNGTLVCFDPNYHPQIWQKNHNGIEYIKNIISKVDIIKPSEDDAQRLFGEDSIDNYIDKFIDLGAKIVILTLGKDGVIASDGKNKITLKSIATDVVDTTGAGDAFWSGFYAGLLNSYTLEKALHFGLATSAFKLKYLGAVTDLPSLDNIKQMYNL